MKDFFRQFREFAVKGNAIDLAVGIVIGTAFGKIISSLVSDVITPPIGLLIGGVDFNHLTIHLKSPISGSEAVAINYGVFLQSVLDFIIVAFILFLVIKGMNSLKKKLQKEEAAGIAQKPADIVLLEEIRDVLKESGGAMPSKKSNMV